MEFGITRWSMGGAKSECVSDGRSRLRSEEEREGEREKELLIWTMYVQQRRTLANAVCICNCMCMSLCMSVISRAAEPFWTGPAAWSFGHPFILHEIRRVGKPASEDPGGGLAARLDDVFR